MSTATLSLAPSNSSAALFRLWGAAISAQLAALGLVQTGDTGQIDWTTVTPGSSNTFAGYEIWRFDDALQSTAPVYLKIEYGSGGSSGYPAISVNVSTGTDGAGTLTGAPSGQCAAKGNSGDTTPCNCYVSGDTNRFMLALWCGADAAAISTNLAVYLMIERTVDVAGAPTAEGVLIVWRDTTSNAWKQVAWSPTGLMSTVETNLGCMGPQSGSGSSGGNTSVYPVYHSKGSFHFPGLNVLGCIVGNFTPYTTTTFTYYGASHTYLPVRNSVTYDAVQRVPNPLSSLLFRFD